MLRRIIIVRQNAFRAIIDDAGQIACTRNRQTVQFIVELFDAKCGAVQFVFGV